MKNNKVMTLLAGAMLIAGSVALPTVQAADVAVGETAAAPLIGMPSPMVEYASYSDMREALGFSPLIFPRSSGLMTTAQYVIGGETADIRYQSRYGLNGRQQSFTVRTARSSENMTLEALSGLHGYTWEAKKLGATQVKIARISDSSYAAVWETGGFAFSAYGQEISYWEFISAVQDNLIDLTEHYFTGRKKR